MSKRLPPQTPETPENPESSQTPPTPSSPEAEASVSLAEAPVAQAPVEPGVPTPANDPVLLRRALEGLLFITDRPLSAAELGRLVGLKDQERIAEAVEELRRDLEQRSGGYRLMAVAEGWQMATRADLAPYVRKLFADRATMRLSVAAQETLSIVAYRQPLTRAEIEEIRGVEVIAALETLLEKRLLKVVGRKETVGRPLLYGTTPEFLRHYGLRSLEDMPPIDTFTPADAADAAATPPSDGPFAAQTPATDVAPHEAPAEESYARAPEAPLEPQTPAEGGEIETSDDGGIWPK